MDIRSSIFKPILNLVVFENEGGYESKYYIESRKIVNKKLGPAKPLSHRAMSALAMEFIKDLESKIYLDNIIDPRIIHINQAPTKEKLIWKHDRPSRELIFTEGTNMPSGLYSIPKLIFIYSEGSVYVLAYKDDELTEKTKLYKPPFPNISDDGRVCMGSAQYHPNGPVSATKAIHEVEKRFFGSRFSHTTNMTKANTQYLIDNHYEAKNPFDNEILICTNKTLGGLINAQSR